MKNSLWICVKVNVSSAEGFHAPAQPTEHLPLKSQFPMDLIHKPANCPPLWFYLNLAFSSSPPNTIQTVKYTLKPILGNTPRYKPRKPCCL